MRRLIPLSSMLLAVAAAIPASAPAVAQFAPGQQATGNAVAPASHAHPAGQPGLATVQPADGAAPAGAVREARPQAQPLQMQPANPALDALLQEWHNKTKGIQKLDGEHNRWIYDEVFGAEFRTSGQFYYEAPDKGRIELTPIDPEKDPVPPATQPTTGQPYALKRDRAEMWICDGQQILQVNPEQKEYESIPIPPEHQGQNIMDGPLPFLFGLPPEKAKQRYRFQLVNNGPDRVFLNVYPLRQDDAANWKMAELILNKATFLPDAVRLVDDPAQPRKRTVYSFKNLRINKVDILAIFGQQPFKFNAFGYSRVQNRDLAAPASGIVAKGAPSVIGLRYDQAQTILKARGYNPVLKKGPIAPNTQLVWHVKEQVPAPDAPITDGGNIEILLYDAPAGTK